MIEGITVKEFSDTLLHALEDAPQVANYVIDNFETVRIEANGYYLIRIKAKGDYGQTCIIRKCLRPDHWEPKDE